MRQLGWFTPGAVGALISVPRTNETITETTRATMLHHELSHGEFFSDPAYAVYVHAFLAHGADRGRTRRGPPVPRLDGLRHRQRGTDVQRDAGRT